MLELLNAAVEAGLQDQPEVRLAAELERLPADTPSWRLPLPDLVGLINGGVSNLREAFAAPEETKSGIGRVLQGVSRAAFDMRRRGVEVVAEEMLLRVCGCRFDDGDSDPWAKQITNSIRLELFLKM